MSRTPFFFVEKLDSYTEKYEIQHPIIWNYNHTKHELAELFPYNASHDLFSIVEKKPGKDFPAMYDIHDGLPSNTATEIKKAYEECCSELHTPNVYWFSYADMYIYCLEHPTVIDYECIEKESMYNIEEKEKIKYPTKPTPLKALMNRVNAFLEVMNGDLWYNDYSLIRIIYWIE